MSAAGSIPRHKTAMSRGALSRPVALAMSDAVITTGRTLFDYGCGRGDDLRHLSALGYTVGGWDPGHRPNSERIAADIVNLGYVVNVIEDPDERATALRTAWSLTRRVLVVSGRLDWEARDLVGRRAGDGVITRLGTFQKFYQQSELSAWIEQVLCVKPVAAAPGIFYVFRDEADEQDFLAERVYVYRPHVRVDPHGLYEANKELLQPLFDFMTKHARPPKAGELEQDAADGIRAEFSTLGRAVNLIYRVTDGDYWETVRIQRRSELLVYAALSRFSGRPKFSQLGATLRHDVRSHFGTYRDIAVQGDRLLVATGNRVMIAMNARGSKIGKQTPTALYVHRTAAARLAPILQVYEGCARVIAGSVKSANILKLSVPKRQVSFLSYPGFDSDAHPTIDSSLTVDLSALTATFRSFTDSTNPPLLHRKEEFIAPDDPRWQKYRRLTASEVKAGLYSNPELIGTRSGWEATLRDSGRRVVGHRLMRA